MYYLGKSAPFVLSTRALRPFAIASCGFVVTELCFPSSPHLLTPPHLSSVSRFSIFLDSRDQVSRFNLSPALLAISPLPNRQGVLRGFKTDPPPLHTGKKIHSFIRAMFKPLCDIPRTSATRRLSLIHYLIPLL